MAVEDTKDINERLQWYLKAYSADEDDKKTEKIDIITQLVILEEFLKSKEFYMCTRELKCECKSEEECVCDSDNEIKLTSVKCDTGSNCNYTVQLYYNNHKLKMPSNKIIRVFYFQSCSDGSGEDEIVAFDIIPEGSETHVVFNFTQPKLTYSITDDLKLGKGYITFTFNYLNYNQ